MTNFSFTEQAELDLEKIIDFTNERWGVQQATKYIDDLYNRAGLLAENPDIGLDRRTITEGLFSFPFESHILYFIKETNQIIITRVLHKSMDPIKHFSE